MEMLRLVPRWLLALALICTLLAIVLWIGARPIVAGFQPNGAIEAMRVESSVSRLAEIARITTAVLWLAVLGTALVRRGREA